MPKPPPKSGPPPTSPSASACCCCIASGTDWQKAGVLGETVIDMIEKGLIVDHPFDRLALTMRGRAVLKAMLPAK